MSSSSLHFFITLEKASQMRPSTLFCGSFSLNFWRVGPATLSLEGLFQYLIDLTLGNASCYSPYIFHFLISSHYSQVEHLGWWPSLSSLLTEPLAGFAGALVIY